MTPAEEWRLVVQAIELHIGDLLPEREVAAICGSMAARRAAEIRRHPWVRFALEHRQQQQHQERNTSA